MGAGNLVITKTLDRLKVVAAAVTGLASARVLQGYTRFQSDENLQVLLKSLTAETQGYFSFWAKGSGGGVDAGALGDEHLFEVGGILYVGVSKDISSDCNSAVELAENLKDAIIDTANWTGGNGYASPKSCHWVFDKIETVMMNGIMVFDFGGGEKGGNITFEGGC